MNFSVKPYTPLEIKSVENINPTLEHVRKFDLYNDYEPTIQFGTPMLTNGTRILIAERVTPVDSRLPNQVKLTFAKPGYSRTLSINEY